ncbi:holin family protein [Roseovarius sp. SCSIO 43702]|uniref:holin family protein n=1 Tax=Roseovarius sp. SCSIO 43702 TaxID=2823043 RepID=UPI001C733523|nr:holin family protein [Roseovarius sp. SCSIO 43702]QYX58356.1 holin family protein [Roseovarius sp. SCSIO 43702]
MGLIGDVLRMLFGGGRNIVRETAEVFRANSEAASARDHAEREAVLRQFAKEFARTERGLFDRVMDGVNRVPRPALALGTLGLFVAAMVDPVWFAARMQGIALVPEPLWWLLGVIVSFYFGARHQQKTQQFQNSMAATMARVPEVAANIEALGRMGPRSPGIARTGPDAELAIEAVRPEANPALDHWRLDARQGGR